MNAMATATTSADSSTVLDLTGGLAAEPPADLAAYFGSALTRRPALKLLDLAANGLGDSGVTLLLQAMRHPGVCRQLYFLGLAKNDLTDMGGSAPASPCL
eukprot:5869417-Prymnesium_polylepis.2